MIFHPKITTKKFVRAVNGSNSGYKDVFKRLHYFIMKTNHFVYMKNLFGNTEQKNQL